jgi:hypothetical protein
MTIDCLTRAPVTREIARHWPWIAPWYMHSRKGACRVGEPLDVGMTGLIGFSSGYYAMLD